MCKNHAALPLFKALTELTRAVGRHMQEFTTNPHAPVPEGLSEIADVCSTMGLLSYRRFFLDCKTLAAHVRSLPRADGFRELAIALNAVGTHLKETSQGASPSFQRLNAMYARLRAHLVSIDLAEPLVPGAKRSMFRSIEVDTGWRAGPSASEQAFMAYIEDHLVELESLDSANLMRFFQGLESRNSHPAVKVWIDASICLLNSGRVSSEAAAALGANLVSLLENGYDGLCVDQVGVLLEFTSSLEGDSARLAALREQVIADTGGMEIDSEIMRQFVAAIEQFKEIVRQGALTASFSATHDASTRIFKHSGKLNLKVVAKLTEAAQQATSDALTPSGERANEVWIYLAMSSLIMQQALDLASRGFDESTLLPISDELARRLADPSIPFSSPLPDSGSFSTAALRASLVHFTKEAGITLESARKGLETSTSALDRGMDVSQVGEILRGPVRESLLNVGASLKTIGATRASALAELGATTCIHEASPAKPHDLRLLTDICGALLLGLERMSSGSTNLLDELIGHEIDQIAPNLATTEGSADFSGKSLSANEQDAGEDPVSIFAEEMMSYAQAAQSRLDTANAWDEPVGLLKEVARLFHTVAGSSVVASLHGLSAVARKAENTIDGWIESIEARADDKALSVAIEIAPDGVGQLMEILRSLTSSLPPVESLTRLESTFLATTNTAPAPTINFDDEVQVGPIEDHGQATPTEIHLPDVNELAIDTCYEQHPVTAAPYDEVPSAEAQFNAKEMTEPVDALEMSTSSLPAEVGPTDSIFGLTLESTPGHGPSIDLDALKAALQAAPEAVIDDLEKLSDQDLLAVLTDEAMSLIPRLQDLALLWSASNAAPDDLAEMRRMIHTLKGCVRVGGMMKVGATLHALEDALDGIEGNEDSALTNTDVAQVFEAHLAKCGGVIEAALYGSSVTEANAVQVESEKPAETGGDLIAEASLEGDGASDNPDASSVAQQPSPPPRDAHSIAAEIGEQPLGDIDPVAADHVEPVASEIQATAITPDLSADNTPHATSPAHNEHAPMPQEKPTAPAHSARETQRPQHSASIRVAVDAVREISEGAGRTTALQERGVVQLGAARSSITEMSKHLARANHLINALQVEADIRIQSTRSDSSSNFDPIELDRYNRLQEVTRALAECIADITMCGTDAQSLLHKLSLTDTTLSNLSQSLQDRAIGLLEVPFDTLAGRLNHVIKLACKDAGKDARIVVEGETNIPGPVLDKLTPCIEHVLRNAVAHGIEEPQQRIAAGKSEVGLINLKASRHGAKIVLVISDDGAGIDRNKVLAKAIAKGLVQANASLTDKEINALLFRPGFSTADSVSQLAGRGVGLDVVASSLNEIGGDVHLSSRAGQGTTFVLNAPTDISSMNVLPVTSGGRPYLIPAALVDQVVPMRLKSGEAPPASIKVTTGDGRNLTLDCPVISLARFVGHGDRTNHSRKPSLLTSLIVMGTDSGAPQAFQVDEVSAQRKINATKLSSLVNHLPGLLATNIDVDHNVVLVINPTRMADLGADDGGALDDRKIVMLVDDSATVRLSTSTALRRAGFVVLTAVDGLDAVEQLNAGARPDIFVFDLEMPRMDGFELTSYVRSRAEFADTKILVVSSRTMQKHRDHVLSLGATDFLGKPAHAQDLVGIISGS